MAISMCGRRDRRFGTLSFDRVHDGGVRGRGKSRSEVLGRALDEGRQSDSEDRPG